MRDFERQFLLVCAIWIALQTMTGQERHPIRKFRECRAALHARTAPAPEPEPEPCDCEHVAWELRCQDCGELHAIAGGVRTA